MIEQRDQIGAETVDRRRARGYIGLAVAAAVVADDAKVLRQLLHLRVPHAQIGAEGVDEHQRSADVGAIHAVGDAQSVDLDVSGGVARAHDGCRNDASARSMNASVLPR